MQINSSIQLHSVDKVQESYLWVSSAGSHREMAFEAKFFEKYIHGTESSLVFLFLNKIQENKELFFITLIKFEEEEEEESVSEDSSPFIGRTSEPYLMCTWQNCSTANDTLLPTSFNFLLWLLLCVS